MKKIVILCVLVVMTVHKASAQHPVIIDQTFSNITIPDSIASSFITKINVKGNNTIIPVASTGEEGLVMVNGVTYLATHLPSDDPLLEPGGAYSVKFAENSNSTFVLAGMAPSALFESSARARVTDVTYVDSTELAISFIKSTAGATTWLHIKSANLNDTVLYLLVDGITTATTVEVVLNNGPPQPGTALTGNGPAFLKIDRTTGAILKQVYFNPNPITRFNASSLTRVGNRFFFSTVNELHENFILHVYDLNLNLVMDIPIVTPPFSPGNNEGNFHLFDQVIGYGQYNGQEYLGLIPKYIPVIVNLTTLDIHYVNEGSTFNEAPGNTAAILVDDSFIFLCGVWIKRIELCNMLPSVIRRDFVTNNPTLNGHGYTTVQRNARRGFIGFTYAELNNGAIDFYGSIVLNTPATSGLYVNGQTITASSLAVGDMLIYKGSITISHDTHPGTDTDFMSPDSVFPVLRDRNRITYQVDSTKLDSVRIVRTTGPDNVVITSGSTDTVDFTNDTTIVSVTLDAISFNDISTIRVFAESAIGIADTSDIGVEDLREEEAFPLYPNPFRNYISTEGYEHRNYDLVLHDMSGKIVLWEHSIGNRVIVDHLVPGIYVARILEKDGKPVSTQKIVKH